ncbi:hypothetical protein [Streptomyces sp. NPDC055400]
MIRPHAAAVRERDKPLGLYALTTSEATKSRLVNETSSRGVAWGQPAMQVLVPGLPFGGVGESGMGHYHGLCSLEALSHIKSVVDVPLSWPDSEWAYVRPPRRRPACS